MAQKSGIYQYYTELPAWAKGVVVVGGLAVIYFAAKNFMSKIKSDANKRASLSDLNENNADLNNALKQGQKLSYPISQYKAWSDILVSAFDGWGTDNQTVFNVMNKMKSDVDVQQLISTFGIKTISSGKLNPAPDVTGTLPKIISDEMTAIELSAINDTFSKKGIKFRF